MLIRESVWILNVFYFLVFSLYVRSLNCQYDGLHQRLSSSPIDSWLLAHVIAENFISFKKLNKLWLFDIFI